MKYKKIAFVIVSVIVILSLFTISIFAFDNNDYAIVFHRLNSSTISQGNDIYGGVITEQGLNGFYSFGVSGQYYKNGNDDTVTYYVLLEGTFEGTVKTFYFAYSTDRYIGNVQVSFTDNISSGDDATYAVIGYSTELVTLDYITYDLHWNDGVIFNPQTTSISINSEVKALKVSVQLHETDVFHGERVPVCVTYQYTDVPDAEVVNQSQTFSTLYGFIDNNQGAINTALAFFQSIWSYSFIQVLITLSVLLTVIAILFNWAVSL